MLTTITPSLQVLGAVQNFMEDAAMFEWAGVGFGRQESYHIAMSLRTSRKLVGHHRKVTLTMVWL